MFRTGVKVQVVSPNKGHREFLGLIGEVDSCVINPITCEKRFLVAFSTHPYLKNGVFEDSELAIVNLSVYPDTDDYLRHDIAITKALINSKFGVPKSTMAIKNVIFHDPATIVYWADGTKTVVKCQPGDIFDPEKGLAMAIAKRVYGDNGRYCELFKKWIPDSDEEIVLDLGQEFADSLSKAASAAAATFSAFGSMLKKKGEESC